MANLVSKSDHNICACLDLLTPNSGDYHDLIKYLKHSRVCFALTIDPMIYEDYIRQFWDTAEVIKVDEVYSIKATVHAQENFIFEASIRSHLCFNDASSDPTTLSPDLIIETFRRMGYKGEFNHTTIRKCMWSYNWRYVCHLVLHCLSSRKSGWDDFVFTAFISCSRYSFRYCLQLLKHDFSRIEIFSGGRESQEFFGISTVLQHIFHKEIPNLPELDATLELWTILMKALRIFQVFKNGEDIFMLSVSDLKKLSQIKILTTNPKGYDFEKYLRRVAKYGFQAYKKNPHVPQRRMSRFSYNVQSATPRKVVRSRAPAAVLPQYNDEYTHNKVSLQPFTRSYVDSEIDELVVERGEHLEALRIYELAQIRCLTLEEIIVLASINIQCKSGLEDSTRDFLNLLTKLSKDIRGIPYEE
ncbi:hypothetical protein L1987_46096 [Smallanthus sonchifolius]|uniref:Uncharacterized protein n=1 Tax=Smallanthus sonchifolius TaxID=185202 RepID=A0ACB9FZR7_9ASTR|nr:hypothetical protein L1987_46096 [Smallanthus sonchifolius]